MKTQNFTPGKFTLFILLFAGMPSLLGTAAVAPVLDLMRETFDAPEMLVNLVLTLPPLATAISGFFIGTLSDKIGRVKILAISLLIFGLAGISGFFLENLYAIIACRLLLGISIAGLLPMVSALITEYYAPEISARYLGYLSASNGICVTILQTACGALASFGWHYSFLIYILGFLALPLVLLFLREPVRREKTIETETKEMPRSVFYIFIYVVMILAAILVYLPTVNMSYYLSSAGITGGALLTGILLGVFGISSMATGIIFWRVARKLTPLQIFSLAFLLEAAGLLCIGILPNPILMGAGLVLIGFALGLAIPNASAWVGKVTPQRVLGRYMSGVTVSVFVGLFCTTFTGPILLAIVGQGNYSGMFLLSAAGAAVIALMLVILIPRIAKRMK